MEATYTTDYRTISDTDHPRFNEELQKYTKAGWMPYGGVSVSTSVTSSPSGIQTHTVYCLLLGKTTSVESKG